MAPKALSLFRRASCALLVLTTLVGGCSAVAAEAPPAAGATAVDVSGIPATTVSATDPRLTLVNGVYLFDGRAYDGVIVDNDTA